MSIWRHLAEHSKRRKNRTALEAYVSGCVFLECFARLDCARRLLALSAVSAAFDRLTAPAEPPSRIVWTDPMRERLRQLASQAPDDRTLARQLGLPVNKVVPMRHKLCGPKTGTAHIARRGGTVQIAA